MDPKFNGKTDGEYHKSNHNTTIFSRRLFYVYSPFSFPTLTVMGSGEEVPPLHSHWSVFDNLKSFPTKPETLMAEIEVAISAVEYTHANSLLYPSSPSSSNSNPMVDETSPPKYDARLADEAYKAGCAALASGKLDAALHSLQISLSRCPPHKTSAIAKLQSLIDLTAEQLHKPDA